jgi:hypothetical protein
MQSGFERKCYHQETGAIVTEMQSKLEQKFIKTPTKTHCTLEKTESRMTSGVVLIHTARVNSQSLALCS